MKEKRFKSQVALISGASGGIGGAIAAALAAEGAEVHALSRTAQENDRYIWHLTDLADDDAMEMTARRVAKLLDRLDIVVHAAGDYATGAIADAPVADLDRLWRTNVRAPYVLTQALVPALAAREGSVVFINSSIWANARSGTGAYATSKYALKAIADALRDELNPAGVRVLSVFPGRTASAMQESIFAYEGRSYDPDTLLQPNDIASLVLQSLSAVRRQGFWGRWLRDLREGQAHLSGLIMRRICGEANVAFRWSFV